MMTMKEEAAIKAAIQEIVNRVVSSDGKDTVTIGDLIRSQIMREREEWESRLKRLGWRYSLEHDNLYCTKCSRGIGHCQHGSTEG